MSGDWIVLGAAAMATADVGGARSWQRHGLPVTAHRRAEGIRKKGIWLSKTVAELSLEHKIRSEGRPAKANNGDQK